MGEFVEAEGLVHLVGPSMGGEYTICGDAFDLGSHVGGYTWKPTRLRTITCPRCVEMIEHCRGRRIARKPQP